MVRYFFHDSPLGTETIPTSGDFLMGLLKHKVLLKSISVSVPLSCPNTIQGVIIRCSIYATPFPLDCHIQGSYKEKQKPNIPLTVEIGLSMP